MWIWISTAYDYTHFLRNTPQTNNVIVANNHRQTALYQILQMKYTTMLQCIGCTGVKTTFLCVHQINGIQITWAAYTWQFTVRQSCCSVSKDQCICLYIYEIQEKDVTYGNIMNMALSKMCCSSTSLIGMMKLCDCLLV